MIKAAFSAHQLRRDQIHPLHDAVIVSDMTFDERITSGGIVLLNDNGTGRGIRPRWGQVYAVGPDQKDVIVAHGRWTRGIDVEDENGKITLRRVDPKDILLMSDQMPEDETFSDAVHVDTAPRHMLHN
jgi:co-chaperonin GroES (HSP10)